MITGQMAADDEAKVYLNGNLVFTGAPDGSAPWSFLQPLTINSGFIAGLNTLTIGVPNNIEGPNDGPTGVLMDIAATAAPVPEPASLTLFGTGIAGLIARRRKNRQALK